MLKTPKTKMDLVRDTLRYMNEVASLPLDEAEGFVLAWRDAALFVGIAKDGKPYACGLQNAKVWANGASYPSVYNGRNERAVPTTVASAQLMALRSQADLVMTLCEPNSSLFDPAKLRKPAKV